MKATLESTTKVVLLNGIEARVWEGITEQGVRIVAFISRLTPLDGDSTQFDAELAKVRAPSPEVEAFPLRLIL